MLLLTCGTLGAHHSPAAFDLPVAKATVEAAKRTDKCIVFFNNFSGPWNPEIVQMLPDEALTEPDYFPWLEGQALGPAIVVALALLAFFLVECVVWVPLKVTELVKRRVGRDAKKAVGPKLTFKL